MENSKLLSDVKKRMLKENLNTTNVSEITKLSRRTIQRFLTEGYASKRTIESFTAFVNRIEPYGSASKLVNIGQVRIPQEHYDYIKRYADTNNVSMAEVFRKVIGNVVDNELLWRGLNDYMELTVRAFNQAISKRIIPFIKIQDEHIKNIEIELMSTKGLTVDMLHEIKQMDTEDTLSLVGEYDDVAINRYREIYYGKKIEESEEDDIL